MPSNLERNFLGFDLSTQQFKGMVVNDDLHPIHEAVVIFDSDLPEFRTHGGVLIEKSTPNVITAPTIMWIKALDMLMDKLIVAGVDFSKIVAVSGAAQQHGSVYWQKGSEKLLNHLQSDQFLHQQLATTFSIINSPTWMDSSTTQYCRELENIVGGSNELAKITGSKGYERFTASQIAKISRTKPDAYKNTEKISLVSSFLCSLLLGKIAPIDVCDGSGMNLMDINTKQWHPKLLDYVGSNLAEKLGNLVPSNMNLGKISPYFVERYGFDPNCSVIACTGDNPSSMIGMRIDENWLAISLGTSDTVFVWLKEFKNILDGHILCNPLNSNAFMGMLCFKNGSLVREKIRNNSADGSWEIFNQLLDSTPRGNFGNMGLYFNTQEILPFLCGDYRFNKAGDQINKFTSLEVEVRALIEGQFIAKRVFAENIGCKIGKETKILATGGTSINKTILQVMSDVFNSPVYTLERSNAALLGATYNAKFGLETNDLENFKEITKNLEEPKLICEPFADASEIYDPMVVRYRNIVKDLLNEKPL